MVNLPTGCLGVMFPSIALTSMVETMSCLSTESGCLICSRLMAVGEGSRNNPNTMAREVLFLRKHMLCKTKHSKKRWVIVGGTQIE